MSVIKWVAGKLRYIIGPYGACTSIGMHYVVELHRQRYSLSAAAFRRAVVPQLLFLRFHQQQLDVWAYLAYLYSSSATAAAREGSLWQPQLRISRLPGSCSYTDAN